MEKYVQVLQKTALFQDIEPGDIVQMLRDMGSHRHSYEKGSFVFYAGDEVNSIGIVLSGTVHIVQEDYWGNRNILTAVSAGGMFAEAFACLRGVRSAVDVVVMEKCEILFIDINRILQAGVAFTKAQEAFAANLLGVLASKNMILTKKIRYMSQRSTRKKLMVYLSDEAKKRGKDTFSINFNRQQLADFLSVDRSAMSAELSRMKRDGLIDYNREWFTLLSEE